MVLTRMRMLGLVAAASLTPAILYGKISANAKQTQSGSHVRSRKDTNGGRVAVTLTALPSVITVNPHKAPAQRMQIATLTNAGPGVEALLRLKPSSVAHYEIYVLPTMDTKHNAPRWEIVEVTKTATRVMMTGYVNDCQHNASPSVPDIDFHTCAHHIANSGDRKRRHAQRDTTDRGPNDPPWISCTTGCCTLET